MKNSIFAILLSITSVSAFASYNTDSINGAVVCKLTGGDGTVSLNANRTSFALKLRGESTPTKYVVSNRQTDGDTSVEYSAKKPSYATLTLSDRNDSIELEGAVHSLNCANE